jgi:hypothetical protein
VPLSTRETVASETLAVRATSWMDALVVAESPG